ncbi:hypothetical protein BDP81DRAFT_414651 [Colletotrichum phormii]|uniref:Uncharacterized protein n=1 Tax=Colletotrichum phormii TaxID=359342 RepID=A0AAJ0ELH5_9PEZI|nr:uncharacterized protein BDP81DRAFT_414651 [Colletotrichum phormii]KAK1656341.1 hypothetical protein BDP81DRAFT_414651 [Colletotrichum phormii]
MKPETPTLQHPLHRHERKEGDDKPPFPSEPVPLPYVLCRRCRTIPEARCEADLTACNIPTNPGRSQPRFIGLPVGLAHGYERSMGQLASQPDQSRLNTSQSQAPCRGMDFPRANCALRNQQCGMVRLNANEPAGDKAVHVPRCFAGMLLYRCLGRMETHS